METARRLALEVQAGTLDPQDIDEACFAAHTSLAGLPDPDLLIRTGGDNRVSNFLLWDLAYSELYFTDTYWPDFDRDCLAAAMSEYAQRQRRFGGR